MRRIEATTCIVVEESVVDQVLDLPVNAVVMVVESVMRLPGMHYVLQRTGRNGWLATRTLPLVAADRGYYANDDIRVALECLQEQGVFEVFVLFEGDAR